MENQKTTLKKRYSYRDGRTNLQFSKTSLQFSICEALLRTLYSKKKKKKIKKVAQNILEDIYVLKSPKTTI